MKPYYSDSLVTIYHGDCREVAPSITADLLLTDPPYGINVVAEMAARSGEQYGRAAAPKRRYEHSDWDAAPPARWLLEMLCSRTKEQIIWGGNYFDLPPARGWLVWDKENGDNAFADCELAWSNLNTPVRLKRHMWNGMLRKGGESRFSHPTQKPVGVLAWCITLATDPKTVFDPFCGSGTTLVAAKLLGKTAIGVEREERYCEIAAERCRQEVLSFDAEPAA